MPATAEPAAETAHAHALALGELGLRVLPIKAGKQHPPMNSWQHAATNDPAKISNWYKGLYRDAGVGLAMGPQPNGDYLFAIDIDQHDPSKDGYENLADLEREHGALPDTWRSLTGGGGQHQIFKAPTGVEVRNQQNNGNRIAPGIDVRGDGGQIVVAPTIHPKSGREYAWEHGYAPWEIEVAEAPGWLVEFVKEPDAVPTPPTSPSTNTTSPSSTVFDLQRDTWDWHTELANQGWTVNHITGGDTYWTRPGKNPRDGHSAVLHGNDVLVIFTTDIPPHWTQAATRTVDGSGWAFGPFGFYAATQHGGDRSAASRALHIKYGFALPEADLSGLIAPDETATADEAREDDWARRNVAELARSILAGGYKPELPIHLQVEGGIPLIYRGRIHSIFGPPGGGKTWVALTALVERLKAGDHVLMIDWEDAEQGTTQRLIQLGCTPDELERFDYRNPTTSLRFGMQTIAGDPTPWTMIVIDSAGEALAAQGVELNDDTGTAQWMQLAKLLTRRPQQPSVVMLDHVPKANEEPAKYAIGSQRKLAAITGASYRCDTMIEPARGKDGKLKLVTAKDRLGNRAKGATAAEIHLHDDGDLLVVKITVSEAQAAAERGERFRPTHLMEKVSRWLELHPGATRRTIEKEITGKGEAVRGAVDVLVEEGWVTVTKVGQSHEHTVIRDYREDSDTIQRLVDNSSSTPIASTASHRVPTASRDAVTEPKLTASPASPSVIQDGTRDAGRDPEDTPTASPVDNPPQSLRFEDVL